MNLIRLTDLEDLKRSRPRTWELNISRQHNTNMGFCQQDFINSSIIVQKTTEGYNLSGFGNLISIGLSSVFLIL